MSLSRALRLMLLVVANLLIPIACLVFAKGFFPYKPLLPGSASFDLQDAQEEMGLLSTVEMGKRIAIRRPERKFDKVIFMVVDALRSDFVFGHNSGFTFTQSLIRAGNAFPFTAHAAPPTVTMPRVKALTTGSVPSFVDLILNFAESDTSSSLASQDTWLSQIKAHIHDNDGASGQLYFYGDDTWLKLFPDFFDTHDGTSSFFVSDFTEVDNNVTRHVAPTLQSQEWDAMIMHYLGLDHIGHKTGPEGPNMLPKQREMDGIVEHIYNTLETLPHLKDTLLVLAGDHGMNSAGNHGGSAEGETSTALVLVSPKLSAGRSSAAGLDSPAAPKPGSEFEYYSKIKQSDLVPTISALLGIPIPQNNLGIIVPSVLDLWANNDEHDVSDPVVQLLYRNALQMLEIVKAQYGSIGFVESAGRTMSFAKCKLGYSGKHQLQCLWSRAQRMLLASSVDARFSEGELAESLTDFLTEAQEQLSAAASTYDVGLLALGVAIALLATISAAFSSTAFTEICPSTLAFGGATILYSVMMFATSYVEEEQHIWYWASSAWLVFVASSAVSTKSILNTRALKLADMRSLLDLCKALLPLVLHRLANRWNQTGQKHAGEADVVKTFFPQYTYVLWSLVFLTYLLFMAELTRRTFKGILPTPFALIQSLAVVAIALVFKINFTKADAPELTGNIFEFVHDATENLSLVMQARLAFNSLAILTVIAVVGHYMPISLVDDKSKRPHLVERLQPLLTVFLLMQSRVANVPLFLLYWLQADALSGFLSAKESVEKASRSSSAVKISLTVLLLTYASFFQLGGSNGISSIDLSNAYNGVSSYNILAVGVLLFAGNWAGPIWWTFTGASWLLKLNDHLTSANYSVVNPEVHTATEESKYSKVPANGSTSASGTSSSAKKSKSHQPAKHAVASDSAISTPGSVRTSIESPEKKKQKKTKADSPYDVHASATTLFTAASLTATMAACTLLRTHLFIWTVFSPKFLFAMAWAVGWHLVVNLVVGGVLYDLG